MVHAVWLSHGILLAPSGQSRAQVFVHGVAEHFSFMANALDLHQAQRLRRNRCGVRIREAHDFLCRLRASLTSDEVQVDGVWKCLGDSFDLTDQVLFDWHGYLANHADAWLEVIFGPCLIAGPRSSSGWRM